MSCTKTESLLQLSWTKCWRATGRNKSQNRLRTRGDSLGRRQKQHLQFGRLCNRMQKNSKTKSLRKKIIEKPMVGRKQYSETSGRWIPKTRRLTKQPGDTNESNSKMARYTKVPPLIYLGWIVNGQRNGTGFMQWPDGSTYTGNHKDN